MWQQAEVTFDTQAKAALKVFREFSSDQAVTAIRPAGQRHAAEMELSVLEDMPLLTGKKGISVLRAGLILGCAKGKVFVPDHAWAMSIRPPELPRVELTEEQARQYQAGQTVPATGKGWALASFAGLNLGWGKISDGVMKNHYPKGLRRG